MRPFRAVITTACTMDGFAVREGESEEHARWSALREVQGALSDRLRDLNEAYSLDFWVVDAQIVGLDPAAVRPGRGGRAQLAGPA